MRARFFPLLLLSAPLARAVENPIPAPLPIDRYEQMLDQSPFTLATPPAELPPAPKDNWANNYVLAALGKIPDENGVPQWLVTVESRDKHEHFELFGNEERDGFSVASVDWSPLERKSTAMLKKGNEPGKLEMVLPQDTPASPQMPMAGVQRPGQPMVPGGIGIAGAPQPQFGVNRGANANNGGRIPLPRPNNFPNQPANGPAPRPNTVQPVVPLPGGTAYPSAAPGTGTQLGVPAPRRVRVINSQQ